MMSNQHEKKDFKQHVSAIARLAESEVTEDDDRFILVVDGQTCTFSKPEGAQTHFSLSVDIIDIPQSESKRRQLLKASLSYNFKYYNGWASMLSLCRAGKAIQATTRFDTNYAVDKLFAGLRHFCRAVPDLRSELTRGWFTGTTDEESVRDFMLQARLRGAL
ncbi:hypothetical protein FKG94_12725 [Exilibacterium tricleocarpae]|uniref:Uncharacterized protein n=1 Tax=Exilibacterium tricleocarpae TaxID=2591008 RepID=A0A545TNS4_9GAMM|nr:hypothetical protein [Exilibacterium tricleocarpae]TQV78877.1 hypothetical protein FKG94_12725 [Exilibacterium tricleocarpae]